MKKLLSNEVPTRHSRGFTMVEMVLSLACMAILMVFTISALSPWLRSYIYMQQKYKVFGNARYGMSRMVKELQVLAPGLLGPTLTTTRADYTDSGGTPTKFELVANQIRRGSDPLFDDVTSLTFTYYDSSGAVLATPVAVPGNVRRIAISVTVDPVGDVGAMKVQGAALLKGYLYAGFRQ